MKQALKIPCWPSYDSVVHEGRFLEVTHTRSSYHSVSDQVSSISLSGQLCVESLAKKLSSIESASSRLTFEDTQPSEISKRTLKFLESLVASNVLFKRMTLVSPKSRLSILCRCGLDRIILLHNQERTFLAAPDSPFFLSAPVRAIFV